GTAGTAQSVTVEVEDPYGNEVTGYTGTVHFTSTDPQAVLPSAYTFVEADGGQHTFTDGVSFKTAGPQTVTGTASSPAVSGTSSSVTITAATASQFVLTGPSGGTAGTAQSVTVEVEDPYGNEVTGYTGTVHFTSTDMQAVLPSAYTFVEADGGQHTFSDGVTLETAGPQTVTVTASSPSISVTSSSVTITTATASQFLFTGLSGGTAGTAQSVTVEVEDPYGNEVTGYTGTVHFTSTDMQAVLPSAYT